MSATIGGLVHVNLRGPEELIERLRRFYRDVIGLSDGPRPPFRSRGYWLYGSGRDLLHLTIDPGAAPARGSGCLDHVAFAVTDLAATLERLDAAGVAYERDEVPSLGQVQLFLTDPAGVGIELNFTAQAFRRGVHESS